MLSFTNFSKEAPPCLVQCPPDGRRAIGRHALVEMCDTFRAVAVRKDKSMTERQLPADGIGPQLDPRTCPSFHVLIVSNPEAEATDRNEIIHGTPPQALGRPSMIAPYGGHEETGTVRTFCPLTYRRSLGRIRF